MTSAIWDWRNWCVGLELMIGPSKEDPLNQYRGFMLMFGPAIVAVRWKR